MNKIIDGIFTGLLLLSGCTRLALRPDKVYIIYRDVPESPSITIIPTTVYPDYPGYHISYVDKIEETCMGLGLKVVVPARSSKEVITKKGVAAQQNELVKDDDAKYAAATIEERWFENDLAADYFIFFDVINSRIKIVKKSSREILTSFTINNWFELKKQMHRVFSKLGFKVREIAGDSEKQ